MSEPEPVLADLIYQDPDHEPYSDAYEWATLTSVASFEAWDDDGHAQR